MGAELQNLYREVDDFADYYIRITKNFVIHNNKGEPVLDFYQKEKVVEQVPIKDLKYKQIHAECMKRGYKFQSDTLPFGDDYLHRRFKYAKGVNPSLVTYNEEFIDE